MAEDKEKDVPWWQSVPAILTGSAALITAIAGLLALLFQQGVIGRSSTAPPEQSRPRDVTRPAPSPVPVTRGEPAPAPDAPEVRAGHLLFRIVKVSAEPHSTDAGGRATRTAVRCLIRVTDAAGVSDYVDRRTFRLAVDGAELYPENSINSAVYERQSVETEALFFVPADARQADLLVGRDDAVARIPIALSPR